MKSSFNVFIYRTPLAFARFLLVFFWWLGGFALMWRSSTVWLQNGVQRAEHATLGDWRDAKIRELTNQLTDWPAFKLSPATVQFELVGQPYRWDVHTLIRSNQPQAQRQEGRTAAAAIGSYPTRDQPSSRFAAVKRDKGERTWLRGRRRPKRDSRDLRRVLRLTS